MEFAEWRKRIPHESEKFDQTLDSLSFGIDYQRFRRRVQYAGRPGNESDFQRAVRIEFHLPVLFRHADVRGESPFCFRADPDPET